MRTGLYSNRTSFVGFPAERTFFCLLCRPFPALKGAGLYPRCPFPRLLVTRANSHNVYRKGNEDSTRSAGTRPRLDDGISDFLKLQRLADKAATFLRMERQTSRRPNLRLIAATTLYDGRLTMRPDLGGRGHNVRLELLKPCCNYGGGCATA